MLVSEHGRRSHEILSGSDLRGRNAVGCRSGIQPNERSAMDDCAPYPRLHWIARRRGRGNFFPPSVRNRTPVGRDLNVRYVL